jgi:hypothetical protein
MLRAEDFDKGHGRIETRRIAVRLKLPAYLNKDWPGLTAIVRLERLRESKTVCSRQIIYAITSLKPEALEATALLRLARAHWQIENKLFRVRDGTFDEDACRVRSGNAPAALAHIRDAALTLIRRSGQLPKPAREAFAENKRAAIRLVTAS